MTAETRADLPPWDGKLATIDEMFLGNRDAINFMAAISRWSHVYDDLIDGDEVDPEDIHRMMWELLVVMPLNPFYRENIGLLTPLIATGIVGWRGANAMESSGGKEELVIAHVTRYTINDLAYMVMVILGGPEHAAKYARDARLGFQRDTLEHYLREHSHV